MIITVKTLQQKTFKIEIDETETVAALKQKIEENEGPNFAAANQKLIYSGKILNDTQPISEYNIQESNFVVVMVSKTRPAQTAPTTKPTETSTSSSTVPSETPPTTTPPVPVASESTVTPMESTDSAPPPTTSSSTSGGASNWEQASSVLVTGSDYEEVVTNLMSLGFDRESSVRALHASYNNPDRAVQYLMGEIPYPTEEATPSQPPQQQPPTQSSPAATGGSTSTTGSNQPVPTSQPSSSSSGGGDSTGGQGEGGDNPLVALSRLPQFALLRRHIQSNPNMLQPLLQQIGQSNPALLQVISQNQEEFIRLLNEPVEEGEGGVPEGMVPPPGGEGSGGLFPQTIQVTQEEKAAIDRLKALGFSEAMVVQAYFACDKNEELAANFLFQQQDD